MYTSKRILDSCAFELSVSLHTLADTRQRTDQGTVKHIAVRRRIQLTRQRNNQSDFDPVSSDEDDEEENDREEGWRNVGMMMRNRKKR